MTRIFSAAVAYLVLGLGAGLFYRELTKGTPFADGQYTQLAVVHTHVLVLGFIMMLLVLVLQKVFTLTASKLFTWFFWVYNAGVVLSTAMMAVHGVLTVQGQESGAAIAGIAGLGHIILTAGLVLLMIALWQRIKPNK